MIRKHTAKSGACTYYVYASGGEQGAKEYIGKATTRRAAEELEAKARLDRARVQAGVLPAGALSKRTVAQAATEFLANHRGRSQVAYSYRMRKQVIPSFGQRRLNSITPADMRAFQDELLLRYAPQTARSGYEGFAMLLSWCKERDWLARHPGEGVKPIKVPERAYAWLRTKGDIARLLGACQNKAVFSILATAVFTGMRQDEIRHLRWDDVDLDRRRIVVHRGRHGMTKSGRVRHVPILDSLLPILQSWRRERLGGGIVFPGRDGVTRRAFGSGMWQIMKNAVKAAELEPSLRFHDLRHTFASHWMIDGGDIFKLSKILGHASVQQTMRYAHLAPDAFDADYGRVKVALGNGELLELSA